MIVNYLYLILLMINPFYVYIYSIFYSRMITEDNSPNNYLEIIVIEVENASPHEPTYTPVYYYLFDTAVADIKSVKTYITKNNNILV
jgi:hypothetical protein